MAERDDSGRELVPVKFSRLARRGLLLGLSLSQVIVLGLGAAMIGGALYTPGGKGLLLVVPVIGVCAALVWVPVGAHKLIEWIPLTGHWAFRSLAGQTVYRWRVTKARPAGTLALPGDAVALRQYLDAESGAVMVHDPHRATLTVLVEVTHPSFILLDPGEQYRRVTPGAAPSRPCAGQDASHGSRCLSGRCPTAARGWSSGGLRTAATTGPGSPAPTPS